MIHVIVDNYAAHNDPKVMAWLARQMQAGEGGQLALHDLFQMTFSRALLLHGQLSTSPAGWR